jgi:ABC-type transport system substrate-binding protein
MFSALVLSACQPVGLKVEQVAAEADLISVRAENCDYGGRIKAIEAVDPHTVRFSLCSPDPDFLQKIASPVFAIQDQNYLDAHQGNSEAMSKRPNGTGPYRLREYIPGEMLTLEANQDYWGIPPKETSLQFRWSADPAIRLDEISRNQVDIADRPEGSLYLTIHNGPSLKLIYRPAMNVSYLGMNNQIPPFNDERVRRAFGSLIQREKIVHEYYPLGSAVAEQFLSPAFGLGYTPAYRWLEYNPKVGLDLLKEAKFDFGQVITLTYGDGQSDYLPDPDKIAQEIQAQLAESGIRITLQKMGNDDFNRAVAEGELALFLSYWKADYPAPANFYETVFAPDAKTFGRTYTDIVFMAREAGNSTDPEVRQSRYNRINELLKLHVPAIPLAHANTALVTNYSVQGLIVGQFYENLEDASLPEGSLRIMQTREPASLWPGDEMDEDTLRVTRLIYDTLVEYDLTGTGIKPSLADYWEANPERTVWTFYLRYGVKFSNGADLDANDVVATFAAQWDAASPNHTGRTGDFAMFKKAFGGFLNN